MTSAQVIEYLNRLPLVAALWWYIENVSQDDPRQTELFFYLRVRYRTEMQS